MKTNAMHSCVSHSDLQRFYVTYANDSNLRNRYSKILAPNMAKAHDMAMKVTGGKFAFVYTEHDFEGQARKYGLTPIALQPQVIDGDDIDD